MADSPFDAAMAELKSAREFTKEAEARGDRLSAQLAEANATIERLKAENRSFTHRYESLEAERDCLRDRVAELKRGKPTPDWEPVAKALGCRKECGFERRGSGFICVDGETCGRYVDPSHSAFAELSRYHEAMTGQPCDSYMLTTDGPSVGPGSNAKESRPSQPQPLNLAGMTLEQAAQARMALGDGEFADLPTFADAMEALREEIVDGRNYLDLLLRLGLPEHLSWDLNDCLQDSWRWCEDAEAQQRPDQHGWRPIASAPKDGTDVLVCCQGWSGAHPARFNGKRWTHRWDDAELVPTHWRPMPELPELPAMEEMAQ